MPFKLPKIGLKRKKKDVPVNESSLHLILHQQLEPYMKKEEIHDVLRKIQRDKEIRQKWDGMSIHAKIKLLRYVASKKEGTVGRRGI